jgi:hypothetical protein
MHAALKEEGFRWSTTAWFRNYRQRCALGLLAFPASSLTQQSLAGAPAVGLLELPREKLEQEAKPLAARRPTHIEYTAYMLRVAKTAAAMKFAKQAALNYPAQPQGWLLVAELEMLTKRRYADARKAMRAAFEALSIAELHTATLESRRVLLPGLKAWLHVLRTKARVPGLWCLCLMCQGSRSSQRCCIDENSCVEPSGQTERHQMIRLMATPLRVLH